MGFPFENAYEAEPCPFLVDRYYTWRDDPSIRMNREDLRGFVPIFAGAFEGAFSDDDTDIELVTLHAVERTADVAERAILGNGGRKTTRDGQVVYVIKCDF